MATQRSTATRADSSVPEGGSVIHGRRARRGAPADAPSEADASGPPAASQAPPVKAGGWGEDEAGATGTGDAPKPSRRRAPGNWTDEASAPTGSTSTSVVSRPPADAEDVDDATARRRRKHFDEDEVIAIVPDLEEDEKNTEDITKQIANAPKNVTRKVQTLTELDQTSSFQVRGATAGIDLGLLTACLSSAEAIQEEDETWEFDTLLQEVSQAMQADIDKQEAEDKEP